MEFTYKLKQVIPAENALGEGLLWRPSDQSLWWTDILGKALYCLPWGEDVPRKLDMPQSLCAFGFINDDDSRFIAAFESGFAYLDVRSGEVEWLYKPDELVLGCGRRLNDGKVGPDGAFWVGAMTERDDVPGGADETWLYRFSGGKAKRVHNGLGISNGLTWSPKGDVIYLSDSTKNTIYKASFDGVTGAVGAFETFARPQGGAPDGAVTDAQGNYWSALWGGHGVACFNASGVQVAKLDVLAPQSTIPVFAGPDLNHVVVCSARDGLNKAALKAHPQSGHVFIFSTSIKGCNPHYYAAD